MISKKAATDSSAQLQTKAENFFSALFTRPEAKNVKIVASYSTSGGSNVLVSSSVDMDTEFMGIVGLNTITVTAESTAKWGSSRLRVALVLDTTGSMNDDGKMVALKTATKNLLTQLQNAASVNGDVNVSIIPFSKNVNLDKAQFCRKLDRLDRLGGGARYPENVQAEQLGSDRARFVLPVLDFESRFPMHEWTEQ